MPEYLGQLHVQEALARFNDKGIFLTIAKRFLETEGETIGKIEAALAANDYNEAKRRDREEVMSDQDMSKNGESHTVDTILAIHDIPVIAINQSNLITFSNDAFTTEYGWDENDLLYQPVSMIMPEYLRDAHKIGFSRFLATEKPVVLGIPLALEILYRDGTVRKAEHFIVGDKTSGEWRFAARITSVV